VLAARGHVARLDFDVGTLILRAVYALGDLAGEFVRISGRYGFDVEHALGLFGPLVCRGSLGNYGRLSLPGSLEVVGLSSTMARSGFVDLSSTLARFSTMEFLRLGGSFEVDGPLIDGGSLK
jgi:hypothetical protein